MLSKLIALARGAAMPKGALWCIQLIGLNMDAAGLPIREDLPDKYARSPRFLGAICGLVDYARVRFRDKKSNLELLNIVLNNLFHDTAPIAYESIQRAVSDGVVVFMDAGEEVQQQLESISRTGKLESDKEEIKQFATLLTKYF